MPAAVPKHPRPHQRALKKPSGGQGLKARLMHMITRGDADGAEAIKRQIQFEQMQQRIAKMESLSQPQQVNTSTARWISDDGEEEVLELTATAEARAYFEQVMNKEAAN